MGEEKGPEFYTGEGYLKEGGFEHNKIIYDSALSLLPQFKEGDKIIELACGVGYLATLIDRDYDYIGIDFSEKVIKKARKLNPNKRFVIGNLLQGAVKSLYNNDDIFICLEALEHIEKDIEVIKTIPSRCQFIFSVPNRDFTSHVRFFTNKNEIIERYKSIINFDNCEWKVLNTNPKKSAKIFMCKARIK